MTSRTPIRIFRAAPWLVALAAAACLGLVLRRDGLQRLEIARLGEGLARARADARDADPAGARAAARGAFLEQAVARGTAQAFVGVDAMDHLDGRRDDPRYALIWHRQQQRIIERQYGHAIASLSLPDGESAELKALLTARREAIVDARDAARQMGVSGPQANMAVEQSVDALTDEIKQLVGSDAYYGRLELAPTISTCKTLLEDTVGLDLAARGEALTSDQLYSLAQGYVDAAYSPGSAAGPEAPDPATGLTPRYQALLSRVSGNLSPAQASAVRDFLVEQIQTLRVSNPSPSADGHDF